MSGGHMDYLCYKVDEHANELLDKELIELAKDFANLLHDCQWYHSSDISKGEYNLTVKNFKNKWLRSSPDNRVKDIIDNEVNKLKNELYEMIGARKHCEDCAMFSIRPDSNYGNCKQENHRCLEHFYEEACENFKPANREDL